MSESSKFNLQEHKFCPLQSQRLVVLSKCTGLNTYIPFSLPVELRHQIAMQVLQGATVRATSGARDSVARFNHSAVESAIDEPGGGDCDTDYALWTEPPTASRVPWTFTDAEHDCDHSNFVYRPGNPRKLFVYNISFRSSQKEVWTFFSQFGEVEYFQLLKTTNQKSKGRGFVTYKNVEDADNVLQLTSDDLCLHDRNMGVQPAKWKKYLNEKSDSAEKKCVKPEDQPVDVEPEAACNDDAVSSIDEMSMLNTHTLLHVFSFLSLQERIQAERVCKRWQEVLLLFWQHMDHLSFERCFCQFHGLRDGLLRSLLKRGNRLLKSVDLSRSSHYLTDRAVDAVGQYCPNLLKLNLSGLAVTNIGLKKYSKSARQLQSIILQNCHDIGRMGLWWLFHQCKELRHIDLTNNQRIGGKCLHVLCSNVDTLILTECRKLTDIGLEKIALRCKKIHNLQLNNCFSLTDAGIQHIARNCPTLSVLHLCGTNNGVTSNGLFELRLLENLTELYVSSNGGVDDKVLRGLVSCKQLRLLDITSCHGSITDEGIASLAACCSLQVFKMGYLYRIDDDGLRPLVCACPLRELDIRACSGLSNQVFQQMSTMCPELRVLDLSGCEDLTNDTIQAFEASASTLPDTLLIYAGGTSIIAATACDNISLNSTDRSLFSLRLDRDISENDAYFGTDDEYSEDDDESIDEIDVEMNMHGGDLFGEMADCYLDCDDPLAEEDWELS